MADLDDVAATEELDRSDMRSLLVSLPEHLAEATRWSFEVPSFRKLCVCGMGGSAIGGDFLATLLERWGLSVSVTVVRGYRLPAAVDRETLVVAISYSGNTEETLACVWEALERGCPLAAVTSGGRLAELAEERGAPAVHVPGGMPPRTAFAYLLTPLLTLAGSRWRELPIPENLQEAVATLRGLVSEYGEAPEAENPAKRLARTLFGRVPVVYGSAALTAAPARRWKTQINENAKSPAYWETLPELHHNEVMGWEGNAFRGQFAYCFLRDPGEHPQVARRFEISRELLEARGEEVVELEGRGEGPLSRLLALAFLGDWVSYHLAMLYEVDPTPVGLIEELKGKLRPG